MSCVPMSLFAQSLDNLYNKRYCELLVYKLTEGITVYNTIKQNDCPTHLWYPLSSAELKKRMDVFSVYKNGPRYWLIDGMTQSKFIDQDVLNVNGLKFNKAAKISSFNALQFILKGKEPYQVRQVHRTTVWVYKKNRQIYEIIDDKKNIYVMQSYSVQRIPQTVADLTSLGHRLHLPKNWTFKTGKIKATSYLKAIDNKAYVIQDEFLNTYQRSNVDFLEYA